jgi:hypothetical protein
MPSRPLNFAGVIAAILFAGALASGPHAAEAVACGLGPPPGSPEFADFNARKAAEEKRNGFSLACEANLARFDVASKFIPLASATKDLAFLPVELAGTPFARLESLGGIGESVGGVKSRLYRGFRTAEGHTVTLFEHDMSADGSSMYRNPADEPEKVNGLPARLVVLQASSGKAVSVLGWKERRRYVELWMDVNAARGPLHAQLFALAGALPKSVPARKDEPAQGPFVTGPHGLPQSPPLPEILSDEQMKALLKR